MATQIQLETQLKSEHIRLSHLNDFINVIVDEIEKSVPECKGLRNKVTLKFHSVLDKIYNIGGEAVVNIYNLEPKFQEGLNLQQGLEETNEKKNEDGSCV